MALIPDLLLVLKKMQKGNHNGMMRTIKKPKKTLVTSLTSGST